MRPKLTVVKKGEKIQPHFPLDTTLVTAYCAKAMKEIGIEFEKIVLVTMELEELLEDRSMEKDKEIWHEIDNFYFENLA